MVDITPEYVLTAISLIVVLTFIVFISAGIASSPPVTPIYLQCNPGFCPTNIYNGEKRCPVNNEALLHDPSYETCNSKYTCDSPLTPFALRADGSTNELGICDTNSICRCVKDPQCPIETLATFTVTNGSIYLQNSGSSRVIFVQNPLDFQGDTGRPLTFNDPNTQFCAIKAYHLNRVSPGACTFLNPVSPTPSEMQECLQRNPCVVGVMAFRPNNFSDMKLSPTDTTAISEIPVTCVPGPRGVGTGCLGTTVPVWNPVTSSVVCFNIAPTGNTLVYGIGWDKHVYKSNSITNTQAWLPVSINGEVKNITLSVGNPTSTTISTSPSDILYGVGNDSNVYYGDLRTIPVVWTPITPGPALISIAFSPINRNLYGITSNNMLYVKPSGITSGTWNLVDTGVITIPPPTLGGQSTNVTLIDIAFDLYGILYGVGNNLLVYRKASPNPSSPWLSDPVSNGSVNTITFGPMNHLYGVNSLGDTYVKAKPTLDSPWVFVVNHPMMRDITFGPP